MTTETVLTEAQCLAIGAFGQSPLTRLEHARAIEQAVLQSPEVRALRKDAERYRFCRSQFGPAEIHIHGVELGLAGDSLDEAMDAEMKEWKS